MELLLMLVALSLDGFAAAVAYGSNHVKMSWKSMVIIAFMGTFSLTLSMMFGGFIQNDESKWICRMIAFMIFFCIGCSTLFQTSLKAWIKSNKKYIFQFNSISIILNIYSDELQADQDHSNDLSCKETLYLGLALSLDSAISGFAAGMHHQITISFIISSFLIGIVMLLLGVIVGKYFNLSKRIDIGWISGIFFLFLAFMKLR